MIGPQFLSKLSKEKKPTEVENIFYFLNELGIDGTKLEELPIPYLMGLLNTHGYWKKREADQMKKANRKR